MKSCAQQWELRTLRRELDDPIGERTIVDVTGGDTIRWATCPPGQFGCPDDDAVAVELPVPESQTLDPDSYILGDPAGLDFELHYIGGMRTCWEFSHIGVRYLADEVRITLFERWTSGDGPRACKLAGIDLTERFTLREPLDGRPIVDGVSRRPVLLNECPEFSFGCVND